MEDPLRVIAMNQGVFLYREALAAGYQESQIAAMRRAGHWHRVRHGAYVFADDWAALTKEQRHLVHARAVLRITPGPVVLSHYTALIAHGIAVWGADLDVVHLTRLDAGAPRRERDVHHHVGICALKDVVEVGDLLVTRPSRAVIEAATILTLESSIVSANDCLHRELSSRDELREVFEECTNWPGSLKVHLTMHHMDGRCESVGESRSMFMFWRQGLPRPTCQHDVFEHGQLIGTTDFWWEEFNLFGEFDGKEKYVRWRRENETPGDVVFREKRREDRITRVCGGRFVRITWSELGAPGQTCQQIRELMRRAA